MAFRVKIPECQKRVTATVCVAVTFLFVTTLPFGCWAQTTEVPILEAELLVVQDDLRRLSKEEHLPPLHKEGLRKRILGGVGLLPWLLLQAGDGQSGQKLEHQIKSIELDDPWNELGLSNLLNDLIEKHPLDLGMYDTQNLSATQRREARSIHDAYCAGCHDDAGTGDPEEELPARDLFVMAKEADSDAFLGRLINGVKGDESMLFTNPLSASQITALWWYYQHKE